MHSTYNKHGLCDVMHQEYNKETACPVKVGQAAFSGEHFPEQTMPRLCLSGGNQGIIIKRLVKVSKVDYGLFRASPPHNPAHNSCHGACPTPAHLLGRVNTPFSHCKQACVGDRLLTL